MFVSINCLFEVYSEKTEVLCEALSFCLYGKLYQLKYISLETANMVEKTAVIQGHTPSLM